jgi:hypothetical protein
MAKKNWVTLIIIIAIIILAIYIKNRPAPETPEELAKCIGENSVLYVQLGCSACKTQEEMFGENYKHLNVVDCWFDQDKCIKKQIEATPTWEIKNKNYRGVKSIDTLKQLTGC